MISPMKRNFSKMTGKFSGLLSAASFNFLYQKYRKFTMIPRSIFVKNLMIARTVKKIPGAIVECGVWRGGMSAALAEALGEGRSHYLFDSFEGLPEPKAEDGSEAIAWKKAGIEVNKDNCKAEIEFATKAMRMAGVAEPHIIKGWFKDTLPRAKFDGKIAVLRLDGDWYESTMDCLTNLYDKVADGGVILIDDYYAWNGCARAVHDFLSLRKLPHVIRQYRGSVAYIMKNNEGKFTALSSAK
jgi:O-methyltransferase